MRRMIVPAARVVDAAKVYRSADGEVRALDGLTADLPEGRLTAVLGPAGSGKSTLLHCLSGLERLSSGEVFLGGLELGSLPEEEVAMLRREQVAFVFRALNLVPTLTVRENVALPLRLAGRRPEPGWLASVVDLAGLGPVAARWPRQLSPAEQQRAAVARALAGRPQVVLADEPTGNLEPGSAGEVLGVLRRAVAELGQTVVVATRDPAVAAVADGVLLLSGSRVAGRVGEPGIVPSPLTGLEAARRR